MAGTVTGAGIGLATQIVRGVVVMGRNPAILNMIKQIGVVLGEDVLDHRTKEASVIETRRGDEGWPFRQGRRGRQPAKIKLSWRCCSNVHIGGRSQIRLPWARNLA
jgi:hypothetical protein